MPQFPLNASTGDPIFRAQNNSISSIRSFSRIAGASANKLNNQTRIVNPGEDPLAFQASQRIRSDLGALRVITEAGQLNASTLGIAIDGLESQKTQLDQIKRSLVLAQAATDPQKSLIQQDIDLAISQIDATANTTRLGNRGLLNGNSTIFAADSIAADGPVTNFPAGAGRLAANSGVFAVKVNKLGVGGAGNTRTLEDGRKVLSFNVSIASTDKAQRANLLLAGGTSGVFTEFRVTGKYGSTTLRVDGTAPSNVATSSNFDSVIREFNLKAAETGVVLVQESGGSGIQLQATGFGDDFFVKVEVIDGSANGATFTDGTTAVGGDQIGASTAEQGVAATASFNGTRVRLGGEFGTTAYLQDNGYDIHVDFGTASLALSGAAATATSGTINVDLSTGVKGVLGIGGRQGEVVHYGYNVFNSGTLGKGNPPIEAVTDSDGGLGYGGGTIVGNQYLGVYAVADLYSGSALSIESGRVTDSINTVDRAIDQIIQEQTRLGIIQGSFFNTVSQAETTISNLASSDADIIGVDAATEITNLIQAQLGVSTSSSVLSQANAIQANIFSLLRG